MRRAGQAAALSFLVLAVFVTGRESSHGVGAFSEHWWCPLPLVAIVVSLGALIAARTA